MGQNSPWTSNITTVSMDGAGFHNAFYAGFFVGLKESGVDTTKIAQISTFSSGWPIGAWALLWVDMHKVFEWAMEARRDFHLTFPKKNKENIRAMYTDFVESFLKGREPSSLDGRLILVCKSMELMDFFKQEVHLIQSYPDMESLRKALIATAALRWVMWPEEIDGKKLGDVKCLFGGGKYLWRGKPEEHMNGTTIALTTSLKRVIELEEKRITTFHPNMPLSLSSYLRHDPILAQDLFDIGKEMWANCIEKLEQKKREWEQW